MCIAPCEYDDVSRGVRGLIVLLLGLFVARVLHQKLVGLRQEAQRRSRSFKVIDVDTNRKPVCDFLLVSNTRLHPIFQRFQVNCR